MQLYRYPDKKEWRNILMRPSMDTASLESTVAEIINEVRRSGDRAVRQFTLQFDKVDTEEFAVTEDEIKEAVHMVQEDLRHAIRQAHSNIHTFHKQQVAASTVVETMPGVKCWRKSVAIEKVGL